MDGGKRQPCSNPFGGISRWPQAAHSPAEIALAKIFDPTVVAGLPFWSQIAFASGRGQSFNLRSSDTGVYANQRNS